MKLRGDAGFDRLESMKRTGNSRQYIFKILQHFIYLVVDQVIFLFKGRVVFK
jgi:hypothetical protein